MKLSVQQGNIQDSQADTVIVNLFQGVKQPGGATGAIDSALDGAVSEIITNGDISGKLGEVAVLYPRSLLPARRVLVAGLGQADKFDLQGIRKAAAAAIVKAKELGSQSVDTIVHGAGIADLPVAEAAQATIEGSLLALYQYAAEKQEEEKKHAIESLTVVEYSADKISEIEEGMRVAEATTSGVYLARDLVNMPPNVATPTKMAESAAEIAAEHQMEITIGDRAWADERDMGAFLAVAKGAGEPPKFIVIEHKPARYDWDTIVLVGKGITFDTGGISIKPTQGMGLMKSDMAGAAAVLGAMKAVGQLDLPLRVVGITPCTENMPDANAYRPADVIRASNGKTIEIISTDAEGRMVLADGLVYAKRFKPAAVIDLATLTGAVEVALGRGMAAGLFSTEDSIRDKLMAAGDVTHERVWPLPLWSDYRKAIKSDVADMKNSGGKVGGVATSAIFLKEFTDYPWAHLDIAGMALSSKSQDFTPAGGTGFGVRLLIEFLRSW
jgi:leucyl aminopeptidase